MKGLEEKRQDEKGKLKRLTLAQTRLRQITPEELPQARSLQRSWVFSHPSNPKLAYVRCHFVQAQLD